MEPIEDDTSSINNGQNDEDCILPDLDNFNEYNNILCLNQFLESEVTIVKNEIDELMEQQANASNKDTRLNTIFENTDLNERSIIYKKTFAEKFHLKSHLKPYVDVKEFKCKFCHKSFFNKSSFKSHVRVHDLIKCYICKEHFSNETDLQVHLNQHPKYHSKAEHQCTTCKKFYKSKRTLKTHLKTHSDTKIRCPICYKMYKQQYYLNLHLKLHYGIKEFKCTTCNKVFAQKLHLINHLQTHSAKKNVKCDICHENFKTTVGLSRHVKRHYKKSGINCKYCNLSFIVERSLYKHLHVHKELFQ